MLRGCGGKQVSGIRCHGVSRKVRGPESEVRSQQALGCHSTRLPTSDFCTSKMKVTPEICMKTKEGKNRRQVSGARCQEKSPRSGVRSSERAVLRHSAQHSGFCLLTPVSRTSKMKVTPGICMKTKEGKNRCQVSGARCQQKSPKSDVRQSEIKRYRSRPFSTRLSAILTPDSCLLSPYELIRGIAKVR